MSGNLVHDEKAKLRAAAFDRASTAVLTVGVVTPVAGILYADSQPNVWVLVLAFVSSLVLSRSLHFLAIATLDDLREDPKP